MLTFLITLGVLAYLTVGLMAYCLCRMAALADRDARP